ncbi:MAG: hypothetical protein AAF223_06015 [Bacteroidota bacterium]
MDKKTFLYLLLLILMVGGIATGFFASQTERNEIAKYGQESTGKVVRIYKQNTRGRTVEYKYTINGVDYTGHEGITNEVVKIGDVFKILYSANNPQYSEILLDSLVEAN